MANDEEVADSLISQQRLKAALHYAVGKKCEEIGEELQVEFSKQMIFALTECTFKQSEVIATDLEAFARHAKRTTINGDDVKLLVRRNKNVGDCIKDLSDKLAKLHSRQKMKNKRPRKDAASTDSIMET
ncbi:Centromere protein S [Trichoplax sp. H2]|uniref:Centromere protein S n=1 Tax=Trichoplax adhaerens TaxID=10228 RepID=B3RZC1_TRIAD|nr:hypothetical protein TRIADDRAFT_57398 [Trichoplax adhaerens]EDV23817.1 hypothetical protein TRIADDRAFT_57398 [Trichoplax adhaerens]RDD42432.1 Centromere protein S [Trichoplax sp. H2]|eukprot:XP_002113343.1 hypothetical protein TRIADDRAFT_57398 [Trichoplax adhaerens]